MISVRLSVLLINMSTLGLKNHENTAYRAIETLTLIN